MRRAADKYLQSRSRHGEHRVCGLLPRQRWTLECQLELFRELRSGQCASACPGKREWQCAEWTVRLRKRQRFPHEHQFRKLLGGCGVQHESALSPAGEKNTCQKVLATSLFCFLQALGAIAAHFCARDGDLHVKIASDLLLQLLVQAAFEFPNLAATQARHMNVIARTVRLVVVAIPAKVQ